MYRRIGSGFCGTVWAADQGSSHTTAIKREDGGPGRSLHNDYTMHKEILSHLIPSIPNLRIPVCHQYLSRQDPLWDELTPKFPQPFQVPCNSLITERIPPFPQEVRERIIDEYCPSKLKASIRSSEPDRDCLVRPYLGRRRLPPRTSEKTRFQPFSLRNYPLHIDRIEDLGLDSTLYAKIMAHTLANIYWKANIDANDIEFVLASPSSNAPSSDIIRSKFLGDHVIWILDFDCCRKMSMDVEGVEQAVAAFYRNDPFYPRPGREDARDQELWTVFKTQFLKASEAILGRESPEARLPGLWVELIEKRVQ